MKTKNYIFMLLIVLWTADSHASSFRLASYLGIGSFTATRDQLTGSEGPLSFGFSYEYDVHSRLSLGAEHFRSLSVSPMGTSVAETGFTGRWYYLGPVPNALKFDEPYNRYRVLQKGMFPYVGWSFGFSQSSILGSDNQSNVVALDINLGFKAGIDYPFYDRFGARVEFNYGFPIMGTGTISYYNLLGGLVYFW